MTRNYMATWRLKRMLANDPCECGNIPRVGYDKGCAECEALDRERYAKKDSVTAEVRKLLGHYYPDWIDGVEVRAFVNSRETGAVLWKMHESGEVERRKEHRSGYGYRLRRKP